MVFLAQLKAVAHTASHLDEFSIIKGQFRGVIALELQKAESLGLGPSVTDNLDDLLRITETVQTEADLAGLRIRFNHARRSIKDAESLVEHELAHRIRGDARSLELADRVAARRRFHHRASLGQNGFSVNRFGSLKQDELALVFNHYQALQNADIVVSFKPLAQGQNAFLFDALEIGDKARRSAFIDGHHFMEGIHIFFEQLRTSGVNLADVVIDISGSFTDDITQARIRKAVTEQAPPGISIQFI